MGRFIGRLHAIGATRSFEHRPVLNTQTHGYAPFRFLIENNFIPDYLKENFCRTIESALEKVAFNFQQAGSIQYIRLHGDCHAGNVLWNDAGPNIVDLDDCLMGPAIQDIWMLLSGDKHQMELQLDRILDGYCEFYDYNPLELRLVETLRTLRMLHYSAWLAKRWEDPAFPLSFPWFNTSRYWEEFIRNINEQSDLLEIDTL